MLCCGWHVAPLMSAHVSPCMQYEQGGPASSAVPAPSSSTAATKTGSGLDGIFADLGSRFATSSAAPGPSYTTAAPSTSVAGTLKLGLGSQGAAPAAQGGGGTKLVFGKKEDGPAPKETDSLLGLWGKS